MLDQLIIYLANAWIYVRHFRVVCLHIRITRELPNPASPSSLNDKFLWRKIFDRNPEFVMASDKLESQVFAQKRCPEIRLPKILWSGSSASDIPPEILNGDVIVKASHGSGYVFPIFAGKYDRADLEDRTAIWLRQTYGRRHGEWGYFRVRPKLYVEEMILDGCGGYGTSEAKLYVYCGQVAMIAMIYDRLTQDSMDVLHGDWTTSTGQNTLGSAEARRTLPVNRRQIEDVVQRLCAGFDHMRCDLYLAGDEIYFGEYTVYNEGGYMVLKGDEALIEAQNRAWNIRQSWFLKTPQRGWRGHYAASLLRQL